jgi:hypothetical protein
MYQRTFIIVFKPADKQSWWVHWIDKNFSHCFLATYTDDKHSVVIEPSEGGIALNIVKKPIEELAAGYKKKCWVVADYTAKECNMIQPRLKFFRNCVGICKDFLGINKWWIITPKQLYGEVKKNG